MTEMLAEKKKHFSLFFFGIFLLLLLRYAATRSRPRQVAAARIPLSLIYSSITEMILRFCFFF